MQRTNIPWATHTWNVLRGCSPISEGCANCYASNFATRFAGPGKPFEGLARGGKWTGRVRFLWDERTAPLKARYVERIFVCSVSDLFHESVTDDQLDYVFGAMWACLYIGRRHPSVGHTFMLLTKRPQRMREYLTQNRRKEIAYCAANMCEDGDGIYDQTMFHEGPHPRIWAGVTVENQARVDERIPLLLQTPAAVRFVSVEPQLGPVDLGCLSDGSWFDREGATLFDGLRGAAWWNGTGDHGLGGGPKLDWVICGCESGPKRRPFNEDWARSLRDQCVAADVPFFYKQTYRNGKKIEMPELDGRVWDQMPTRMEQEG